MEILFIIFIFSFYVFIINIKNIKLLFLNITLLTFSIYAIAHLSVNSEDYSFLKTLLYNHFTPFYLLTGPSYYFFIKFASEINFKLEKGHLVHLIPFIIQCIAIHEYVMIPWEEKMELVNSFYLNPRNQSNIKVSIFFNSETNYLIRFIHLITYFTISIIQINKVKQKYSVRKLKKITLIAISIFLLYQVHVILIITNNINHTLLTKIIIYIDVFLLFFLFLEFINSPELYLSLKKINKFYLNSSPFSVTKNKILINEDYKKEIAYKISELIKKEDVFINTDYNFRDFASFINFPDHIIRDYLKLENTTFTDIKNKVRVSRAKKILEESKFKYNLSYISEQSGFNSKSNFYSIFKKYEKCTPREYLHKKKLI